MSVSATLKSPGLLRASGLAAMAAALSMMIAPSAAMAQDRGQGRWGGGQPSAQSQGAGNNGSNAGAWRGNRGGDNGSMRGRSFRGEANARQNPNWTANRARAQDNARQQDNAAARARIEQAQRQQRADTARQAEVRRDAGQWSGRNRTYSDQERNRTYRQGWRDGNRNDSVRDRQDNRQAYRQGWRDNDRNDRRNDNWRRDNDRNRYAQNNRNWNRDWRNDNRYNWYSYRSTNRNHYRLGRYYAPYRNYSYRRLSIGYSLDSLFFGSRYWINDPWSYRLPPAYGGYRWVRYYDDALLVDTYSGEVVDVIYDFFW